VQASYVERDAQEVAEVKESVPVSLQTFYLQVRQVKPMECPLNVGGKHGRLDKLIDCFSAS
jgi:hypothetical protein